ncbi:Leucine-responsive regulatory protein [Nocardia africana]|uniref:Leucine-responsive regulatory protein n=1 Tax=Nocardia africana TaxID=134964 RepID=A0A378WUT9_9NOCA|nr:Leucine-responsive regulatory protein [Nocardia africana]
MAAVKDLRRRSALDDVDLLILEQLARNARTPNNALAEHAGIAPSTCHARLRSLIERGVIRGFHADIDPAALGRELQAMIAVRVQTSARKDLQRIALGLLSLEEVMNVYFIAGVDDYLVHVATPNSEGLRNFVLEHLSAHPAVATTQTILIFEHMQPRALGAERADA